MNPSPRNSTPYVTTSLAKPTPLSFVGDQMLNYYIPLVPKFNYALQYKKVKHEHKSRGGVRGEVNNHHVFRHDYYDP
jgi:hypothetical protein